MTDRSFTTECPVCFEDLFDENGVADKEVAETMCLHLIHSDCLAEAGRALNADGQRYGFGGFGARAGCPVCDKPVSCWQSFTDAGNFKAFWTTRIEDALKELGSVRDGGRRHEPVPGELLRNKLKDDPSLTGKQKAMIRRPADTKFCVYRDPDSGYLKCLDEAGGVNYSVDQVVYSSLLCTRGIWKYDWNRDQAWLWEWGLQTSSSSCNNCGSQRPGLKVCTGCKDSSMAAMYCGKGCQRADWRRHKKDCRTFQIMRQGGTKEELLQRLRALR